MTTTKRTAFSFLAAGAVAAALAMTTSAAAPRFYNDDPVWHDRDTEMPRA
jgi:hypothetical protein